MKLPELISILRAYNIKPDKTKGQHFLLDETVVRDMLAAAKIKPTDNVLEVGPGPGVLTSALVQTTEQVVAYELDPAFVELIAAQAAPNLTVVGGDVMNQPLPPRGINEYKVVANIPYSITGGLIRKLLTSLPAPQSLTLLIQREVAERICATPGQMSILAVAVQLHGIPRIIQIVPANSFWPVPKVESAVIQIDLKPQLTVSVDQKQFMRLVKIGFSQKRKQLKNTLSAGLKLTPAQVETGLVACGLKPTARAQELSLSDWANLLKYFQSRPAVA